MKNYIIPNRIVLVIKIILAILFIAFMTSGEVILEWLK